MKKRLSLFTLAFTLIFVITIKVNAKEVKTPEELSTCLNTEKFCKLTSDIKMPNATEISSKVTLDLNGYTIKATSACTKDSIFIVLRGAEFTVDDSSEEKTGKIDVDNNEKVYAAIKLTKAGETSDESADLIINNGTIIGYYYAISGNGTRHNTNVTINGGKLTAYNKNDSLGIYNPQNGTVTINGGEITGTTGIEIRAGKLVVNGGTITGTGIPTNVLPNGNGSTTTGAGIAVAQHTTKLDLEVNIKGGTIKGFTAFYESNPEKNDATSLAKVKISITGGSFVAINGGKNTIVCEDFKIEDIVKLAQDNKSYEIVDTNGEKKTIIVNEKELQLKVVVKEVKETEIDSNAVNLIQEEITDKYHLATYLDIVLGKFTATKDMVDHVEETTEAVSITIPLPTTLEKVQEGYIRKYFIVRVHNGTTTLIDDVKVNSDNTLTFNTDKFSTYALVYQDTEKTTNPPVEPETTNPETGDYIITYILLSLIAIAGLKYSKKIITKYNSTN